MTTAGRRTDLVQLRKAAGLTVSALAKASGIARETIHRIESGRRIGSVSTLEALAGALGVQTAALLPVAGGVRKVQPR